VSDPLVLTEQAVRDQLATASLVVVFRPDRRETGRTAWRASPDSPLRAPVLVSEVGPVDLDSDTALRPYRRFCGFSTLTAWRTAIRESLGRLPASGMLYYVAMPPAENGG